MFFEVARFARILKPQYLFLENVKGLLNHDRGRTFATILCELWELGYDVQWQVLNSKNFGLPQSRNRVFIVASLRGTSGRKIFPIEPTATKYINEKINGKELKFIDLSRGFGGIFTEVSRCLTARQAKGMTNRIGECSGVAEITDSGIRIRKFTPLECFRLQGFPDSHYYNAKNAGVSNTQLYKQTGNSVSVPVVYEIAKRL